MIEQKAIFIDEININFVKYIHRAAKATGFRIQVGPSKDQDYIRVYTLEPAGEDHNPFWLEFARLRANDGWKLTSKGWVQNER